MSNSWKWIKVLLLFGITFVLQVSVADWMQILGVGPDLVIIFVVAVAIICGPVAGAFWGFLAGFTQDIYAPIEWLGAHTISMTVIGFLVGQLEERILTLNAPAKVGVLSLGYFICDALYFFITGLEKDVVTNLFFTRTLPGCAYTMFVGAVFFYLSAGKSKKHA